MQGKAGNTLKCENEIAGFLFIPFTSRSIKKKKKKQQIGG